MQKNKYLDDLGLKQEEYGINFTKDNDKRKTEWEQQREVYGFDERETWNMGATFIEWLYSHLKMYDEVNIVNTNYHTFEFQGKTYTQQELMDLIMEKCEYFLLNQDKPDLNLENKAYEEAKIAIQAFAEVFPAMWW